MTGTCKYRKITSGLHNSSYSRWQRIVCDGIRCGKIENHPHEAEPFSKIMQVARPTLMPERCAQETDYRLHAVQPRDQSNVLRCTHANINPISGLSAHRDIAMHRDCFLTRFLLQAAINHFNENGPTSESPSSNHRLQG